MLGFLVSVRQALRNWDDIRWNAVLRFVPGSLVGVPIGLWVVKTADSALLARLLGVYVVAYALYSLFGERLPNPDKQLSVLAGISHASFQQKNYRMVYHILHGYFTQPAPVYVGPTHGA